MIALIDGDLIAYRCSASAENDLLEISLVRTDKLIRDILEETGSDSYKIFISGDNNFRYKIFPKYKISRRDTVRPKHLIETKQYLVKEWFAEVTDGYEADDALGIHAGSDTVICTIDKDLLQIAGHHYNFVKKDLTELGEREAQFNFWQQMMTGDRSDDIPGFDGVARNKVPKFISNLMAQMDDFEREVFELYQDPFRFLISYNLLRIWRRENDLQCPEVIREQLIGKNPSILEGGITLDFLLSTENYLSQ